MLRGETRTTALGMKILSASCANFFMMKERKSLIFSVRRLCRMYKVRRKLVEATYNFVVKLSVYYVLFHPIKIFMITDNPHFIFK